MRLPGDYRNRVDLLASDKSVLPEQERTGVDFERLFHALPGLFIVLRPDGSRFTIVAVSNAFLQTVGVRREDLLGRDHFEVFPAGPDPSQAATIANLRASLALVLQTGQPDTMTVQRYDLPDPGFPGGVRPRYWSPINSPVPGPDGRVALIVHRVEDVTDFINLRRLEAEHGRQVAAERSRADRVEAELYAQSRELVESLQVVQERERLLEELRQNESRKTFLLALEEQLRDAAPHEEAIVNVARAALAAELGARVGYSAVKDPLEEVELRFFTAEGECSGGRLAEGDPAVLDAVRQGVILRRDNAQESSPGAAVAVLAVPVQQHGRTVALLAAEDTNPRRWADSAVELAREVAGRTWAAVQRARAEEALRDSERRLAQALEAGELGAWELDLVTHAAWRSLQHDQIFGYPALLPEWTYEMFLNHVLPEDRGEVDRKFQVALAEGSPWSFECRIRRADGVVRWIWAQGISEPDANGRPRLMKGMVHDITERKTAEDQLRRTNSELEEFAYVVSHDLQEPLRMVNIFTQMLTRELDPLLNERTRDYSLTIQKNVRRMEQLLRDLLQFSRHVHQSGESDAVDLNESLSSALSVLQHRIEEEAAAITCGSLPVVRAEATQMGQVFQNLIGNALKYRKPGEPPRIRIDARQTGSEWIISVQDNGIGFAPEHAERIFGLFRRLHHEQYPGTGLGLAICKRVIERCGGRIWAESQPGVGSTFFIALPVHSRPQAAEPGQGLPVPAEPR